jgi:hypothetical protein
VFVPIPDFNKNKSDVSPRQRRKSPVQNIRLRPLRVRPSAQLWRLQWVTHLLLSVLLLWVFIPWLHVAWIWPIGLLSAWIGLGVNLYFLWCKRFKQTGSLEFGETGWRWCDEEGHCDLVLKGSVIVWPALVILPFKGGRRQKQMTLVLLSDSLAPGELRRLRVWLRTLVARI